jgi:hypothetical protein
MTAFVWNEPTAPGVVAWAELGTFDEINIGIVGYAAQFDRTASDRAQRRSAMK